MASEPVSKKLRGEIQRDLASVTSRRLKSLEKTQGPFPGWRARPEPSSTQERTLAPVSVLLLSLTPAPQGRQQADFGFSKCCRSEILVGIFGVGRGWDRAH